MVEDNYKHLYEISDLFLDRDMDEAGIENALRLLLESFGEDPERTGLKRTPMRVAQMYNELLVGYRTDPVEMVNDALFEVTYDEMVLVRDIEFYSLCEHHLLPFMGKAHVAYIPRGKVIGVSKLARVVEGFARRPQVQERLTCQIAELLMDKLDAKGAGVIIEANHTCMTIRGVRKPGAEMVTSAMLGTFRQHLATRTEAIKLLTGQ